MTFLEFTTALQFIGEMNHGRYARMPEQEETQGVARLRQLKAQLGGM